jgi:integrase/recombinase XerD
MIYFAKFLGYDTNFYEAHKKRTAPLFLNTRTKNTQDDPDKRWIRTWNDYLQRIKYFFRWLYNQKERETKGFDIVPSSDWTTPGFAKIKETRSKRIGRN